MAFRDGGLYGWVQLPGADESKMKPIKESSLPLQRRADILGSFKLGHCSNKNESFIFNVLTIPILSRSSEAAQPLRFQAETKVKQVVKKIRDESGVAPRENETDYVLMIPKESEQGGEASPRVTHAHSHNNVVVMDDILLEPEFPLWVYDVSPVQTLYWKELTFESIQKEREKQPVWIKIILPDCTCRVMKFDYNTKISSVLTTCKERIKALESLEMRYYGLYWFTKMSGTFLDEEKRLCDYHIGVMDILQIRKALVFEAAFLSNTDDHPQTLVLNQSTKINQIIKLITAYVAKGINDECERYGLVHIPSSGITTSTLHWLDLNKSLAELNISRYDILEFKERKGVNPTLMSTIDLSAPSVKLIFTQTPDDSHIPNETNNTESKRDSSGHNNHSANNSSHLPTTQPTNVPANFTVEEGERIITQASDVTYHNQNLNHKAWHGTLFVTTYKLVFQSKQPLDPYLREFFSIPLGTITKIEKIGYKEAYPQLYGLFIGCKDLRKIVFEFQPSNGSRKTIYKALSIVLFRGAKHVFAFEHTYVPKSKMQVDTSLLDSYTFPANGDGWQLFDMGKEFKRLFLQRPDPEMQYKWRLSEANQNYQLCPTYPSQLIVPYQLSDEALFGVAQFRSKGRFPILSYLHLNQAALLRCAQPLVGLKRMRSQDDENYLSVIRDLNPNRQLTIIDARPMKNAIANFARGGGYELVDFYPNSEVEFANIENIHAMRAALGRLQNLVSKPVAEVNQTWFTELEATKWLDHIRAIMEATYRTVFLIDRGRSVLVHCSDGWDRTAQIDGLAQICLDPFFRTIVGFEILIEKEWLSYGHMFQTRIGHGEGESGAEARSPIFLQFIDCVFQLTKQFPTYFQWNEKFLISLLDHLYSCKYGTFLFNSEKERLENHLKERTPSYWTFIHDNIRDFTNPFFMHSLSVISPSYNTEDMVFWKGYYARWHRYVHKQHSVDQRGMAFIETISQMTTRLKNMEAAVEALKQENQALKQTESNPSTTTTTNARS